MEKTRKAKEESDRNCKQALGNTVTLGNARRSTLTKVHLSKSPIYIKKIAYCTSCSLMHKE